MLQNRNEIFISQAKARVDFNNDDSSMMRKAKAKNIGKTLSDII